MPGWGQDNKQLTYLWWTLHFYIPTLRKWCHVLHWRLLHGTQHPLQNTQLVIPLISVLKIIILKLYHWKYKQYLSLSLLSCSVSCCCSSVPWPQCKTLPILEPCVSPGPLAGAKSALQTLKHSTLVIPTEWIITTFIIWVSFHRRLSARWSSRLNTYNSLLWLICPIIKYWVNRKEKKIWNIIWTEGNAF